MITNAISAVSRPARDRDRILAAVCKWPGISLTELAVKAQLIRSEERRAYLAELTAAGKITERIERPAKGPLKATYWPTAEATTRPAPAPDAVQQDADVGQSAPRAILRPWQT